MEHWNLSLTSNGEVLGEVDIKKRIFLEYFFRPFYHTSVIDSWEGKYMLLMKEYKLNHLLFMDDLELFSKSEAQIETLAENVQVLVLTLGWSLD